MKIYRGSCQYIDRLDVIELADQDDFFILDELAVDGAVVYRPIGSHATPGVGYELKEPWEGWFHSSDYPGLEYALFVKIGD